MLVLRGKADNIGDTLRSTGGYSRMNQTQSMARDKGLRIEPGQLTEHIGDMLMLTPATDNSGSKVLKFLHSVELCCTTSTIQR